MFEKLFKKNKNITKDETEPFIPIQCSYTIPIQCSHNADNEHCNLILELQKQQSLKKEIEKEVEMLRNNDLELIQYFINFLQKLEDNGLCMNKYNKSINHYFDDYYFISIFNHTVNEYSFNYIFKMTEELKTYKNKANIICEKQKTLRAVEDNIKDIKSKLGIE